ncbi:Pex12 amino terminal region-domain-containing protein [Entophlyctis helioformis]|nr:Pex12 amino terminal region-domain-containing protein [Entophlyctis helioformis]
MEFLANLDGSASAGDAYRPSVFELFAQEHMRDLLAPAFKYVLTVYAQRYPRVFLPIHRFDKWVFALAMAAVEFQYLKEWGGSFAENFYGLCRAPVGENRALHRHTGKARQPLTARQIRSSLLALIAVPLIKAALDEAYEHLSRQQLVGGMVRARSAARETDAPTASASGSAAPASAGSAPSLRERFARIKQALLRTFKRVYPFANASYMATLLAFQVAYIYGKTPHYDPWLFLSGLKITRMSVDDFRDHDSAVTAAQALRFMRYAVPMGFFFFNFLEWWYTSDYHKKADVQPIPPPPDPIPPHEHGVQVPDDKHTCPLCLKRRTNPAVLPTGYAFCYPCAYNYVAEYGRCPVTHAPVGGEDLRKIY